MEDMPPLAGRQTMLFSATFPREIQLWDALGQETDKRSHLMDLLQARIDNGSDKQPLTLVFVETKNGADSLDYWLCGNSFDVTNVELSSEVSQSMSGLVFSSYEKPDQVKPFFDVKGVETVCRDTCEAVSKTMESSLKTILKIKILRVRMDEKGSKFHGDSDDNKRGGVDNHKGEKNG
uniref:Uncharacterized protein n=1 Tax=Lactuca sativa TaxID=4236 RepID=A0A9R1UIM5_LACSA|nr:hypothetical protein LSAT_V11C900489240 [Lactuca sativa]